MFRAILCSPFLHTCPPHFLCTQNRACWCWAGLPLPWASCAGCIGRYLLAEPMPQSIGQAIGMGRVGCWPQRHRWYRLSCQSVMPFWPHRGILCSGINSLSHKTCPASPSVSRLPILSAGDTGRPLPSALCPSYFRVQPYTSDRGSQALHLLFREKQHQGEIWSASCPQEPDRSKASVS